MAKVIGREKNGRFAKGNTGGGRTGTACNKEALDILRANSTGLVKKAVELALAGSEPMLKLCLDKLMPTASLLKMNQPEMIDVVAVQLTGEALERELRDRNLPLPDLD